MEGREAKTSGDPEDEDVETVGMGADWGETNETLPPDVREGWRVTFSSTNTWR